MDRIRVSAGSPYDVIVERGLLDKAGRFICEVTDPCRAAVISDETVLSLYGDRLLRSLSGAGFDCLPVSFPAGEASKNLSTYARLLNTLAREHFSRSDLIIALGGGVTGDLAGFTAATYLRGIRYVQIPTTLLAAADSSVGGKTAVDLEGGKNLAGAFHQPVLVLCDPDLLKTLPEEVMRDGTAEVIKYGMLGSEAFFASLEKTAVVKQAPDVIAFCVGMKRDLVEADEFDTGVRRKLNLGHSFGHAIEKCSGYTVSHGRAVAVGMAMITRAAVKRGLCGQEALPRLLKLLKQYGLPAETDFSAEDLYHAALSDKKITGDEMHLIVPEAVGRCRILPLPEEDLLSWLKDGGAR